MLQWPLQPFPAADTCPITVRKANMQSCGVVVNTLSPCKMIKYEGKLRPGRVKRWSSCLVLLLVSPFLMWFIILLRWLVSLPIFATRAPLIHATLLTLRQEIQQNVRSALDTSPPVCRLLRKRSKEYHRPNHPHPGMKGFSSTLAQTSCHPLKKSSIDDERPCRI